MSYQQGSMIDNHASDRDASRIHTVDVHVQDPPIAVAPSFWRQLSNVMRKKLVVVYQSLTALADITLNETPDVEEHLFRIELTPDAPKTLIQPARRLSHRNQELVSTFVADCLETSLLIKAPNRTRYVSNLCFPQKPDGSVRVCLDPVPLNNCTIPMPMLRMDVADVHLRIDRKNACMLSVLDVCWAFWLITIHPEDRVKTTFRAPGGLYMFRRMPFGLMNASAAFERYLTGKLGHLPFVTLYMDDVLITSPNVQQHVAHLEIVVDILHRHHIPVKTSKCQIMQETVRFLGMLLFSDGEFFPGPEKISAISKCPVSNNAKELRSYLGICRWIFDSYHKSACC